MSKIALFSKPSRDMNSRAVLWLSAALLLWTESTSLTQLPKDGGPATPPPSSEPGRIWNPFQPAADNHPLTLRILVLNYNPVVPAEGHRRLSEVFKWNEPERLALRYLAAMEYAAGGAIRYEIVEWRNLNEIYAQRDGYRYTVEEYVRNRRAGGGWHEGKGQDYPRLLREQGVAEMVSRGMVDEVWIFSDHFFGVWEASMAGPGAFNINGGVYPEVPSTRPFAFYGFNYERGVAEMMHDAAHRTEATLNRVYGGWKLANPVSNWDKFSANAAQSNGVAGVGTCHWPANAEHDYDYGNPRTVESWADAFLTYPQLDWVKKPVSRETWASGRDHHTDYMKWYFAHVPRAPGVNADGRQNNWFKYIWDFENYDRAGKPLPGRAKVIGQPVAMVGEGAVPFAVGFSDAGHIDRASLGAGALEVLAPDGARLPVSFTGAVGTTSGPFRVAGFAVAPAGGKWQPQQAGTYRVRLRAGAVKTLSGGTLEAAEIGTFRIGAAAGAALAADADTLLLWPGEGDARLTKGQPATHANGLAAAEGVIGRGITISAASRLHFPCAGNLDAAQGTIEFWLKPGFAGDDRKGHTLLRAGASFDRGLLLARDGAGNLRFILWGDDRATPAAEKNVERGLGTSTTNWPAGQWTHLAFTWNGATGLMELYVNGRAVESNQNGVQLKEFSTRHFSVGAEAEGGEVTPGIFDELRISARVRSAEEIAASYQSGLRPGALTPNATELLLAPGEKRRVLLSETGSTSDPADLTHAAVWTSADPAVATVTGAGRITAAQPGRTVVSARHAGRSVALPVEVRAALPTARLAAREMPAKPNDPLIVKIAYRSTPALAPDSLGSGDLLLLGTNGLFAFADAKPVSAASTPGETLVTYTIPAPAAGWPAAGARGQLQLKAWQVHDRDGAFFPETDLGPLDLPPRSPAAPR